MTVRRNAFGRQVDSFEGDIDFEGLDGPAHAFHPRPWVEQVGPEVAVLARADEHIVAVRQGPVLATAFHPEMTGDRRMHRLFVDIVTGRAWSTNPRVGAVPMVSHTVTGLYLLFGG